jgi:hypothetical protein
MKEILEYNRTACQEEFDDQPGFYSLNRQFIQECSEFVCNINDLEDSPWKNKDIVQWIRGDLKCQIGHIEVKLLKFLQQEYFLKDSPCFCKHKYIAERLETGISSINAAINSLDKKGFLIKISWIYKGRRMNTMLLPQIPALVDLIDQKNYDNKEYRKIYNKFRKLFTRNSVAINKKREQRESENIEHTKTTNKLLKTQQVKNPLLRYSNILYINTLFNNNLVTINTVLINSSIFICRQIATLGKSPKVASCSDNTSSSKTTTIDNHKVDTHIDSNEDVVINKGLDSNQTYPRFGSKEAFVDIKELNLNKELDSNQPDPCFGYKEALVINKELDLNKELDSNQSDIEEFDYVPPRKYKRKNRTEDYRWLNDKELNAWMYQLNKESTTQFTYHQKVEFLKQQKEEEQRLIDERNQKIIKNKPVAVIDYPSIPDHENRFKTILNQERNLIDELLADNLLNEVKSSIMLDRHLLKRKIRNERFMQKDMVKRLADNDYDFDKIPVYDQNCFNDYISCFHSIDMKIHFKIPSDPERRKKTYHNYAINVRRCLLRLISTGNEIEWDYADKVIEYWNKLPISSGGLQKVRIGSKDSKAYINAAIVISDCLIHGANRNLNTMFKAMDRLVTAEEWKKPPFNWINNKPTIDRFFMINEKNKLIQTYFGNDIDFEKFIYAKKYKKKNLKRLEVGYEKFTELYVNQFYGNNIEKGKEVCYRFEHMIKNWLEEKIEDIKNTCHKSGQMKRKLYNYSLITDRQNEYGNIPPLLQRFFYYINRKYQGSITFVDMFTDKTWNDFIINHMQIEVGLTDFWEPIRIKRNGNGKGGKEINHVTARSTRYTRIPAIA